MWMTANEKNKMLDLIEKAQNIADQKTKLVEEILALAKKTANENDILRCENNTLKYENETLKRHLEIAENCIFRSTDLDEPINDLKI